MDNSAPELELLVDQAENALAAVRKFVAELVVYTSVVGAGVIHFQRGFSLKFFASPCAPSSVRPLIEYASRAEVKSVECKTLQEEPVLPCSHENRSVQKRQTTWSSPKCRE